MKIKIFVIVLLVAFSIPAVFSLFHSGFFQSDDGEWMIIRFSSFYQSFSDGQFPVRFLTRLNFEYGYPVANFLYPGFMYLGVPIHILGFGFVDTIKIIFGASMVGSAIFCYLWLSRFFDKLSSFVGALFYLYTPYHLFDLYKRGSIGEVLALAILPFILWQIERKSFFWSAIGIAFLIISHNTLAVLFLGLILLYITLDLYVFKNIAVRPVIPAKAGIQQSTRFPIGSGMTKMRNMSKEMKELLKNYFLMMILSLGLSAFFWIPAFFELQYTVFPQTQVSDFSSYFANTDLIGFSTIFILFLTAVFMITSIIKIKKHRLTLLMFIIGLVSVFFSTSLSSVFWNILPVSFIQFPFRLLSLTIVSISFLAACVVSNSPKKLKIPIAVLSLIILIFSAKPFIVPSEFFDKGEGFYATNMDTTTVKNEYMPKWVKEKPVERYVKKVEVVEGVGSVNNISYDSKKVTFDVLVKENMKVRINTIYYPGWKAIVYLSPCHPETSVEGSRDSSSAERDQNDSNCEGKELAIDYQNQKGVMELDLPKGENKVELKFSETPLRLSADLLSIFSFISTVFVKWFKPGMHSALRVIRR